ncbi:MAG: citrate (Si)-synthase, partial [Calditrichaeota bacterium]|nr:citrate (Si)-synthase [Calditrichota bacterium]
VHSDHEGANASVLTSRIVNSSLSDLYYSISGSMNSLAGPLHGLANQESVKFVLAIQERFAGVPDAAALSAYVWDYLSAGNVIPGFGHAVLRSDDPRYRALYDFGKRVCPENPVFRIVELLGEVVPPLLKKQGKAKNPYPNIDGISGALLYHFGITDLQFYTVMFSTAQVLGICAQLISTRAIGTSIFRPKSV